jgi:hypothetical protein
VKGRPRIERRRGIKGRRRGGKERRRQEER